MADGELTFDVIGNFSELRKQAKREKVTVPLEGEDSGGGGKTKGGGAGLAGAGKTLAILGGILAFLTNLDVIVEVLGSLLNVISFALAPVAATLTKQLVPILLSIVQGVVDFFSDPIGTLGEIFRFLSNLIFDGIETLLARLPFVGDRFRDTDTTSSGGLFGNFSGSPSPGIFPGPSVSVQDGRVLPSFNIGGGIEITVDPSENFDVKVQNKIFTSLRSIFG